MLNKKPPVRRFIAIDMSPTLMSETSDETASIRGLKIYTIRQIHPLLLRCAIHIDF